MGIDARILLRLPFEPTNEQLVRWSWYACETFGADQFLVANRLPQTDPQAWNYRDEHDGAFERVSIYKQDGPEITPRPGESLVRVNVMSVGYERGDLLFLCALAEWCELNVQGCEVWYGGDSSGVLAAPWPAAERDKLRRHLYTPDKGRDYFSGWESPIVAKDPRPDVSACRLCLPEKRPARLGSGPSYVAYHCHGCGLYFTTHDAGVTWTVSRGRNP